ARASPRHGFGRTPARGPSARLARLSRQILPAGAAGAACRDRRLSPLAAAQAGCTPGPARARPRSAACTAAGADVLELLGGRDALWSRAARSGGTHRPKKGRGMKHATTIGSLGSVYRYRELLWA